MPKKEENKMQWTTNYAHFFVFQFFFFKFSKQLRIDYLSLFSFFPYSSISHFGMFSSVTCTNTSRFVCTLEHASFGPSAWDDHQLVTNLQHRFDHASFNIVYADRKRVGETERVFVSVCMCENARAFSLILVLLL